MPHHRPCQRGPPSRPGPSAGGDDGHRSLDATSSFTGGGGAFQTTGSRPDRNRFNLGGDVTFYSTDRWEFRAAYDMDLRQDYVGNSGVIRATYHF